MSAPASAAPTASRGRDLPRVRTLVHLLLVRPLLRLVFGVGVEGRENLEGVEQMILVANHNSHLDTLLLFQLLPRRLIPRTHPVAALDYFGERRGMFRMARLLFRPVWITRGESSEDALQAMRERLRDGRSLIVFPEGTRGEPGEMIHFRTGVGRLAEEFRDVPVVPVFLAGAERALPRSTAVPVPVWARAVVGLPQRFHGSAAEVAGALEGMVRELGDSEVGRRHRRQVRPRNVPTVAVLGIDGSGKSSLSRELARRLSRGRAGVGAGQVPDPTRVCLVSDRTEFFEAGEPAPLQPLVTEALRRAIGRRAKTASSLRSYKVPKLAELLLRDHVLGQAKRWYAPGAVVSDGCPLLNIAAWVRLYRDEPPEDALLAKVMGILSGRERPGRSDPVYTAFPELWALGRLPLPPLQCPEAVLFLDVDPAVSMERIRGRGEGRQAHETGDKLARLREGYLSVGRVLEREWRLPVRTLDGNRPFEDVVASALEALEETGVLGARPLKAADGGRMPS